MHRPSSLVVVVAIAVAATFGGQLPLLLPGTTLASSGINTVIIVVVVIIRQGPLVLTLRIFSLFLHATNHLLLSTAITTLTTLIVNTIAIIIAPPQGRPGDPTPLPNRLHAGPIEPLAQPDQPGVEEELVRGRLLQPAELLRVRGGREEVATLGQDGRVRVGRRGGSGGGIGGGTGC